MYICSYLWNNWLDTWKEVQNQIYKIARMTFFFSYIKITSFFIYAFYIFLAA